MLLRSLLPLLAPLALPLALGAQAPAPPAPTLVHYDVRDLPLVELPAAPNAPAGPASRTLAIVLTGDGDWAELVKGIAGSLSQGGVAVVGVKARAYLQGGRRTPDGAARDVERIARHYGALWNRDRLVLVGYSRGADMLPFVVSRLPADLRARLAVVGMYGLAQAASFEFHWTDLVSDTRRPSDLPVPPELAKLRGVRMFCVYGEDEKDSACRDADPTLIQRIGRGGAHHFDKDYAALGRLVLDQLR